MCECVKGVGGGSGGGNVARKDIDTHAMGTLIS